MWCRLEKIFSMVSVAKMLRVKWTFVGATYTISTQCYLNLVSLVARETPQYFYKIHWCMVKCILFLKNTTAIMEKLWPWRGDAWMKRPSLFSSKVLQKPSHYIYCFFHCTYLCSPFLNIIAYTYMIVTLLSRRWNRSGVQFQHSCSQCRCFDGYCSKQTLW